MIRNIPAVIALGLLLAACATTPSNPLPVCDGKHRRPANLYGSVLKGDAPTAKPVAPAAPSPGAASPSGCAE